ncbi:MAG: hypothetical protein Q8K43_07740 [Sulfurimicrobium sp.]|jgi:hypothetical protein|nr:hypothetical protein [Sulfurimicrobium sp.]MDP2964318.1 hypothetical protein [Sulfurimicrobium sp.]MDZ7655560.1 hypothetical protein [Sulfurimicrobium sp.]
MPGQLFYIGYYTLRGLSGDSLLQDFSRSAPHFNDELAGVSGNRIQFPVRFVLELDFPRFH